MITADKIRKLAYLDSLALERALRKYYPDDQVISSQFLGITNSGQFCYNIVYPNQLTNKGTVVAKVFVDLDANDQPVAEY